jgi:hypothetical protein
MNRTYLIVAVSFLVVAVAIGAVAFLVSDGPSEPAAFGADGSEPTCGELAGPCGTEGKADPPVVVVDDLRGGDMDGEAARFVGHTIDEAIQLAEDEGRVWRIARTDDESFVLTSDLMVGRVTFEVDDGVVTAAVIERESSTSPTGDGVVEDQAQAELLAEAVLRLLTVDNTFGGGDPFADLRIAMFIDDDPGRPLQGLELELIAAAVEGLGSVRFIDDAGALTRELFEAASPESVVSPEQVAVVTINDVLLLDDRAEVELSLWCGPLCGTYLTYEAVPSDGMWDITGTVGPIAVS